MFLFSTRDRVKGRGEVYSIAMVVNSLAYEEPTCQIFILYYA